MSKLTGINQPQITRFENGDLKAFSSNYLIRLSKALKKSADYILGLTRIMVQKSYDISELGFSGEVIKTQVLEKQTLVNNDGGKRYDDSI